jgi:hypothetical protein
MTPEAEGLSVEEVGHRPDFAGFIVIEFPRHGDPSSRTGVIIRFDGVRADCERYRILNAGRVFLVCCLDDDVDLKQSHNFMMALAPATR